MLVNLDETAIYFEAKPRHTVHETEFNTVSFRSPGSSNHRFSACFLVTRNGSKLCYLSYSKTSQRDTLHKIYTIFFHILGLVSANQTLGGISKAWIYDWNRSGNSTFETHVNHYYCLMIFLVTNSLLLLICYMRLERMFPFITVGYTCVLQPCKVGVMKSTINRIQRQETDWGTGLYSNLPHTCNVLVPRMSDLISWLCNAWKKLPSDWIFKTSEHIGLALQMCLHKTDFILMHHSHLLTSQITM